MRLVLPYAVWMVLMMALPATAWAYAVRTAAAAVALGWTLWGFRDRLTLRWRDLWWGFGAGLLVLALWVLPEELAWYRQWCIFGDQSADVTRSAYDPAVNGWTLTAVHLFGSAVVIAIAEELFFRRWLVRFAGFWWMVALFALEHDRFVAGAVCGVVYGLIALRVSLKSAIVAHVTTNFLLGVYVLQSGAWRFW